MKLFKTTFMAAALLLAAYQPQLASAAPGLTLGEPTYGGSGCPAGSAAVSVSPDGKEISVIFDKYIAKNGRKNCQLTIPVTVPAGFQVSIFAVDYRGYVAPNTTGRLSTDYFFAGQKTTPGVKTIVGETDYTLRDDVAAITWSKCGAKDNMRITSGMAASGAGDATVDSTDIANYGLVYYFNYQPC